jgi:hypothetical protein
MTEVEHDFIHPQLGTFRGLASESTIRLLGVQYAELENKFAKPILKDHFSDDVINASKLG